MAENPTEAASDIFGGLVHAFLATILLWAYFTIGFVAFFLIVYLAAFLFSPSRERAFQRLNSLFYRGFFLLVRVVIPRHRLQIDDDIRQIRSSVIVCNHLSYLDPLILISLHFALTSISTHTPWVKTFSLVPSSIGT